MHPVFSCCHGMYAGYRLDIEYSLQVRIARKSKLASCKAISKNMKKLYQLKKEYCNMCDRFRQAESLHEAYILWWNMKKLESKIASIEK